MYVSPLLSVLVGSMCASTLWEHTYSGLCVGLLAWVRQGCKETKPTAVYTVRVWGVYRLRTPHNEGPGFLFGGGPGWPHWGGQPGSSHGEVNPRRGETPAGLRTGGRRAGEGAARGREEGF